MADDDLEDFRINSLNALTKRSPRVVLEEHSHCEVPAGCGGVVLRWRDPLAGVPVIVRVATMGQVRAFLNGSPVTNAWLALPPGEHVLTFRIDELPPEPSPFLFTLEPNDGRADRTPLAASALDAGWRVHHAPPEDLAELGEGTVLESGQALYEAIERDKRWRFQRLLQAGAVPIVVRGPSAAVRGPLVVEVP